MKICRKEAELFHADRQTDRHGEANSRFSKFCDSAETTLASSGIRNSDRPACTVVTTPPEAFPLLVA